MFSSFDCATQACIGDYCLMMSQSSPIPPPGMSVQHDSDPAPSQAYCLLPRTRVVGPKKLFDGKHKRKVPKPGVRSLHTDQWGNPVLMKVGPERTQPCLNINPGKHKLKFCAFYKSCDGKTLKEKLLEQFTSATLASNSLQKVRICWSILITLLLRILYHFFLCYSRFVFTSPTTVANLGQLESANWHAP